MAAAHQLDHAMFERSANKLIGTCLRKAQCHADLGIGQSLHPMHLESPPLALGQFGKRAMKRLQLFAPFHCSTSVHSKIGNFWLACFVCQVFRSLTTRDIESQVADDTVEITDRLSD